MKTQLGQESAFPLEYEEYTSVGTLTKRNERGISKRLYIATVAMQGFIQNNNQSLWGNKEGIPIPSEIAIRAYEIADEMLKQEDDEEK